MDKIVFQGKAIFVTGYTATGKTNLAVRLAKKFGGQIISADSRQVYKYLDIGSGKDLEKYKGVVYHLIDICHPKQNFNLYDFKNLAIQAMGKIVRQGKVPIICGGTPLYIDCLLNDYEFAGEAINREFQSKFQTFSYAELKKYFHNNYPKQIKNFDLSQTRKIIRAIEIIEGGRNTKVNHHFAGKALILAPSYERGQVYKRIGLRLEKRWEKLICEVQFLKQQNLVDSARLNALGLEYRYINDYLEGHFTSQECFDLLARAIRKFAKRQGTWFRKLEKQFPINWVNSFEKSCSLVNNFL